MSQGSPSTMGRSLVKALTREWTACPHRHAWADLVDAFCPGYEALSCLFQAL